MVELRRVRVNSNAKTGSEEVAQNANAPSYTNEKNTQWRDETDINSCHQGITSLAATSTRISEIN
jgi:hypothetical protein